MSNTKTVMSQAANTQGLPLDITDVFSTYLYEGDDLVKQITNGVDLDGEGGLVWIKSRDSATSPNFDHMLFDTERGATKKLASNTTASELTNVDTLTSFNSDGFTVDDDDGTNKNLENYASWTFRKAPKFFDVVTYTGTGSAQTISHSLGSVPGMVIVKNITTGGANSNWTVWHKGLSDNSKFVRLNTTDAEATASNQFNGTAPTSTVFSVGTSSNTNASGDTFVAYLFAHNDGDGEFGPSGDQDIIKCGSYTGTGVANDLLETLGFEPQWMLVKRTNAASDWIVVDTMRGAVAGGDVYNIYANQSDAEVEVGSVAPDAVGIRSGNVGAWGESNASGGNYIYIAIRRGPMRQPESGTEVFDVNKTTSNQFVNTGFPVDLQLGQFTGGGETYVVDRLRGMSTSTTGSFPFLRTQGTNAESSNTGSIGFNGFVQDGFSHTLGNFPQALWSFRRAPGFFDVVAYTGDGTAGRTVSHNLGVAPEMMWVKRRSATGGWGVYHKTLGASAYLVLQVDNAAFTENSFPWNDTAPTESVFTLGSGFTNQSSSTYIAYLFATLAGISKVGSYTGNGSSQTIDCGFTSGARFILVKRTDSTGDWYVWDTERGIVAGNDPYLELNTTDAEVTSTDWVDPDNSGFIVNGTTINASSAEYIFYAIA